MSRYRYKAAEFLVSIANRLIRSNNPLSAGKNYCMPDRIYDDGFQPRAYSYKNLKSLTEQDGPKGFGATATIKWLISDEGWKNFEDMSMNEIRRDLAMSGIDLEDEAAPKSNVGDKGE